MLHRLDPLLAAHLGLQLGIWYVKVRLMWPVLMAAQAPFFAVLTEAAMKILFSVSMLGFIASAAANVLSYFGSSYGYETVLIVMLVLIGLPLPSTTNKKDILTLDVPLAYKVIAVLLALYSLVLFFQPKGELGVITKDNDRYLRENRGKIIREASRAEYLEQGGRDARLASSLTMAGFFITGMIYLSKSRE